MDVIVTSLKCQIASLETQLICANQEKQKLQDTVICLSKALSSYTQNVELRPTDEHYSKKHAIASGSADGKSMINATGILQAVPSLNQNSTLASGQPPIITERQDEAEEILGASNLIDLSVPTPKIASSSVSDLIFKATNANDLHNRDNLSGARIAGVPSGTMKVDSPTDLMVTQLHVISDDKPPILDLQFRGLHTALDGPKKKSTAVVNSTGPHSSVPILSFDEIYGKIPNTDQDKTAISTGTDQITSTVSGLSHDSTKSQENSESNINTSDANGSPTSLYHFGARSSIPSHESSSAKSINYFREPLSLSHGIRFQPKEDNSSTTSRVMVFNLPKGISVSDLLSKIRGGTIISCKLLDTAFAYGNLSAMIRFSTHSEALFCVDYAATTPLIFRGRRASVQLIPTPTYPLAPDVYQNVFEHGHTRCLRINAFHRIKHSYVFGKYTDPQHIEYQATNDCGDWFVRFTSLRRASALWADLQYFRVHNFGGGFMPDPCNIEESIDLDAWKAKNIQVMEGVPNWKI